MGNEQSVPLSAYQARIQQQQQQNQAGAQRTVPRRPQPAQSPPTRRPPTQDASKPKTSTFLPPDPFVFFGLTPECNEEQAKRAYYRKTREHHPDRGGDVQLFAWIHQAYITVLHQIQERNQRVDEHLVRRAQYQRTTQEQTHQATASQVMQQVYQPTQTQMQTERPQHQQNPFDIQQEREQELQQPQPEFQPQAQQQNGTNYQPPVRPVGPEPKFQADKFNRIFEETRIERPSDRGYSPEELDRAMNQLPQAPVLNGQSQLRGGARDQFNQYKQQVQQQNEQSIETDERARRKKQLAKYRGPEALVSTSFANCFELGDQEVDDYTAPIQSRMGYTDYQGAYTKYHQLEAPEEELQRRPQNLESYQAERERVRFQMSADEEAQLAALKAYEEEQERMRIERLQEADRLAELQHEKAKKFYLQGRRA
jgi:hypothetical protein